MRLLNSARGSHQCWCQIRIHIGLSVYLTFFWSNSQCSYSGACCSIQDRLSHTGRFTGISSERSLWTKSCCLLALNIGRPHNTILLSTLPEYRQTAQQNPAIYFPWISADSTTQSCYLLPLNIGRQHNTILLSTSPEYRQTTQQNPAIYFPWISADRTTQSCYLLPLNIGRPHNTILLSTPPEYRQTAQQNSAIYFPEYRQTAQHNPAIYSSWISADRTTKSCYLLHWISADRTTQSCYLLFLNIGRPHNKILLSTLPEYRQTAQQNPAIYFPWISADRRTQSCYLLPLNIGRPHNTILLCTSPEYRQTAQHNPAIYSSWISADRRTQSCCLLPLSKNALAVLDPPQNGGTMSRITRPDSRRLSPCSRWRPFCFLAPENTNSVICLRFRSVQSLSYVPCNIAGCFRPVCSLWTFHSLTSCKQKHN